MTSIINASVSSNGIVSTADASGILLCQSNGVTTNARVWANFYYTGSVISIRASYNVSSITYNAAGDYTINFTNALADANYSVCGTTGGTSGAWDMRTAEDVTARTSSLFKLYTANAGAVTLINPAQVNIAVFGN
jgi:hypothetical protein